MITLASGSEVPIFSAPAPLIVPRKRDKAIILDTPRAAAECTSDNGIANQESEREDNGAAIPLEDESRYGAMEQVDVSKTRFAKIFRSNTCLRNFFFFSVFCYPRARQCNRSYDHRKRNCS